MVSFFFSLSSVAPVELIGGSISVTQKIVVHVWITMIGERLVGPMKCSLRAPLLKLLMKRPQIFIARASQGNSTYEEVLGCMMNESPILLITESSSLRSRSAVPGRSWLAVAAIVVASGALIAGCTFVGNGNKLVAIDAAESVEVLRKCGFSVHEGEIQAFELIVEFEDGPPMPFPAGNVQATLDLGDTSNSLFLRTVTPEYVPELTGHVTWTGEPFDRAYSSVYDGATWWAFRLEGRAQVYAVSCSGDIRVRH